MTVIKVHHGQLAVSTLPPFQTVFARSLATIVFPPACNYIWHRPSFICSCQTAVIRLLFDYGFIWGNTVCDMYAVVPCYILRNVSKTALLRLACKFHEWNVQICHQQIINWKLCFHIVKHIPIMKTRDCWRWSACGTCQRNMASLVLWMAGKSVVFLFVFSNEILLKLRSWWHYFS